MKTITIPTGTQKSIQISHELSEQTINVVVEPYAQLTLTSEISAPDVTFDIRLHVQKEAQVTYNALLLDAQKVNGSITCFLQGPRARADIRGVYLLGGEQTVELKTLQHHQAEQTESNLVFKGVLNGSSRAVYHGNILIDESARYTNANQENKNIMLSDAARATSVPAIEVLANEVQCGHGSAIGQLDREQLFYLQARGIPKDQAMQMLLEGFVGDLFEDEKLKKIVCERIKKL